jgi:hypothetical protein
VVEGVAAEERSSALAFRRRGVIAAAGLSGVIVLVSMFVDPVPNAEGRELIEGYAAEPGRQGLHTNLIHYGFALLAPAAFAAVGLVRARGAWLANVAAVLAVLGLTTLPGLVLIDYVTVAAANVTDVDTAYAIEQEVETLPGFTAALVPAFLSSMLAIPLAGLALWRARLAPWWLVPALVVGFVAPNVIEARVGFTVTAVALLLLAWVLARIPPERWHGRIAAGAPPG